MKIFFDTGVWLRWYGGLQLPKQLRSFVTENAQSVLLSTTSIYEVTFKFKIGKLPMPDPRTWIDDSLEGIVEVAPSSAICAAAAEWEWSHCDSFDRIIAASAVASGAVLVHTDSNLKELPGFSQRYFRL